MITLDLIAASILLLPIGWMVVKCGKVIGKHLATPKYPYFFFKPVDKLKARY